MVTKDLVKEMARIHSVEVSVRLLHSDSPAWTSIVTSHYHMFHMFHHLIFSPKAVETKKQFGNQAFSKGSEGGRFQDWIRAVSLDPRVGVDLRSWSE